MNKKIFLTSAVIMCMACPAIAESFPQDGNMVENETYANAAVYDNTGVYEGTATANAYYTTNNYNVSAGSYFTGLDANNDATTATCTSGNYCPGVQSTTYDDVNSAFVDDGLQTCPSGYASSDLGASANTQCYRTCDINNMSTDLVQGTIANIAHAATLTGNDYYGNGTDTCEPATCVSGWHRKAGINGSAIATTIGNGAGENSAVIARGYDGFSERNYDGQGKKGQAYYGITEDKSWAVDYGSTKGILVGTGRCSSVEGDNNNNTWTNSTILTTSELGEVGGNYCYCNVTGYKESSNQTLQDLSSPWVYLYNMSGSMSSCAADCGRNCAYYMRNDSTAHLAYRTALLGSIQSSPASCEANTINITWNDASAEDIAATGAATTVYEGDIKTPLKAVTKPGKTFVGWKFIKPQQ